MNQSVMVETQYIKTYTPSRDQISQLSFCLICSSFPSSTSPFPPVLSHFHMMLFSSRILCLAASLSTILCCALVTATPRQTAAPVRARQASTDTVEPDSDEDPNVSIDNTDRLRKGMNETANSSKMKLILTISRGRIDIIHKPSHSDIFTDLYRSGS